MPAPLATVLTASSSSSSPASRAAPTRTCRSLAFHRPSLPTRCHRDRGKKPNPGPTAPPLLLLPLWLDRCLHIHALAAAGLALVLAVPLLPAAHASSSVGARSPLDAAAHPCEDVRRYYAGLGGLAGDELRTKLAAVVSPHAALRYQDVWEALKILDAADAEHPEASSEVIEIYSQRAVPKILAGKPDGWNINSSRGNKYFGGCHAASINCMRPANHEAASDTETDTEKWAPPIQVRGDVARSLMYMAVSYGSGEKNGTPHLELSDSPSIQTRKMGLLSALLRWNELDLPSRSEQLRNDRVCRLYQQNRNPFVDNPEYANLIWRNPPAESSPFTGKSHKAWVNEFHYENKGKDKNEIFSASTLQIQ